MSVKCTQCGEDVDCKSPQKQTSDALNAVLSDWLSSGFWDHHCLSQLEERLLCIIRDMAPTGCRSIIVEVGGIGDMLTLDGYVRVSFCQGFQLWMQDEFPEGWKLD